jgi:hypothetical protein
MYFYKKCAHYTQKIEKEKYLMLCVIPAKAGIQAQYTLYKNIQPLEWLDVFGMSQ